MVVCGFALRRYSHEERTTVEGKVHCGSQAAEELAEWSVYADRPCRSHTQVRRQRDMISWGLCVSGGRIG